MDIDYETHNPLLILRTLSLFQAIIFLKIICLYFIIYPLKVQNKFQFLKQNSSKLFKRIKKGIFFNEILVLYIEGQIELLIAAYLYWNIPENNPNNTLWVDFFAIYFFSIPMIVLPSLFFWMFTKNLRHLKSKKF